MKKELLDNALDDAFINLFDEVKKNKKSVFVAVCATEGSSNDKMRTSMHGEPNAVLAAICVAIHRYAEETHTSITEVLLRIARVMSEEE